MQLHRLRLPVSGENPDGTIKTEPARRSITMRELMTHTGGLGYGLSAASPVDRMFRAAGLTFGRIPLQQMVEGVAKIPLLTQPGTRWSYSIAVDVQGHIVEKPLKTMRAGTGWGMDFSVMLDAATAGELLAAILAMAAGPATRREVALSKKRWAQLMKRHVSSPLFLKATSRRANAPSGCESRAVRGRHAERCLPA